MTFLIFLGQVGLLVMFNLVTLVIIFPAVISLDLIRRSEQKVDVFCCFTGFVFYISI
jgi:patched 1 protein